MDDARAAFVEAVDRDFAPMHLTSSLVARMQESAEEVDRPLIDLGVAVRDPRTGLPDPARFLDHTHLTVEGHALVATHLAERWFEAGLLPSPPEDWATRFAEALDAHRRQDAFDEGSRRRSRRVIAVANATFYIVFGNFTDALPIWRRAFELGTTGDFVTDANLTFFVLFCVDALAGRLESELSPAEQGERTRARYAEMRAAVADGSLLQLLEGWAVR